MARITGVLGDPFIWVMLSLYVVCNGSVSFIFYTIYSRLEMTDLRSQVFAIRLMQMTLGMLIGTTITTLGMIAAWFGLKGDVGAELDSSNVKGRLASAGPGALLVVCGTLLIYLCIEKEFVIDDNAPITDIVPAKQTKGPS